MGRWAVHIGSSHRAVGIGQFVAHAARVHPTVFPIVSPIVSINLSSTHPIFHTIPSTINPAGVLRRLTCQLLAAQDRPFERRHWLSRRDLSELDKLFPGHARSREAHEEH